MSLISGKDILGWGWLETQNLIKTVLPIVGTTAIAYLTTLTLNTSTPTAVAIGAIASIAISALKQLLVNNTAKTVTVDPKV